MQKENMYRLHTAVERCILKSQAQHMECWQTTAKIAGRCLWSRSLIAAVPIPETVVDLVYMEQLTAVQC